MATAVAAQDLPRPPSGFEWQRIAEIKGALLRPSSWSFAKDNSRSGWRFVEPKGRATFSVTVVTGSGPVREPKKLASDFLAGMSSEFRAESTWGSDEGPFVMRAGFFIESKGEPKRHRAFTQILVNPKTGTLFVVGFEAPEQEWEEEWKVGQVVCKLMLLDDDL